MTKKNIVEAMAEELGLTQLQIKQIVPKTLDAIVNTLVEEGQVELRNFGVFEVRWRKPHLVSAQHALAIEGLFDGRENLIRRSKSGVSGSAQPGSPPTR